MKITNKWLESKNACAEARIGLINYKGNTDSIAIFKMLIKKEKLDWATWLCTGLMTHKQQMAYAIYAAEQVIEIFEKQYPDDNRPRKAIKAAKSVLKHNTKRNRYAANAAANAAADAANAANATNATNAAAYAAAYAAADAADAAAYAAADAAADAATMKIKIIRYGIKLLKRSK